MTDSFLIYCADGHSRFVVDRLERVDVGMEWFSTRPDATRAIHSSDSTVNPGAVYADGVATLAQPDRWRHEFRCKACPQYLPARDEKLQPLVSTMFDGGMPEIDIRRLRRMLNGQ